MNIKVSYGMLETLQERVSQIVEEFEQASARREDLVAAVGRPDGEERLQNAVSDFESQWDDRRKQLREGLETVRDNATKVLEGWKQGDQDIANGMEEE
ncbi:MAG TPA: hypothetical protein VFM87_02185 [Agrococcus sp.]|nr:hypothetical protein [Agrococcus sp.]